MLSARQYEIMELLQRSEGYTPVWKIAEALQVSQKTVRNEINTIKKLLRDKKWGEIDSRSRVGVRLLISSECWEKVSVYAKKKENTIRDSQELLYGLLEEILKKQGNRSEASGLFTRQVVSYSEMEKKLCLTRPVMERLLPQAVRWMEESEILLEKKRGEGLVRNIPSLKQEYVWSAALVRLEAEMERAGRLPGQTPGGGMAPRRTFYESFLGGFDIGGVEDAIKKTEKQFGFRFTYEGFWQVLLMTAISVQRVRRHEVMDFFAIHTRKTDSEFDEMAASCLTGRLERNYGISLPVIERDYIAYVLEVADIQGFTDMEAKLFCQSRSMELCRFTVKIASLMEDITGRELKKDDYFVESLFLQLRSMIGRRKYELKLRNPLVRQARQKYQDIFVAVHGVVVFVEKELGIVMNEEETCSLVLLLGGALLRGNAIVDVCIICNYYGIGSAHILKEKLEREIKDLNIVAEFSVRDLMQVRKCSCDLIISAVPIENPFHGRTVVLVEELLLDYDIDAIEAALKKIRKRKMHGKALAGLFETKRALFSEELVWFHMKGDDKYSVITAMCEQLADKGFVTEDFQKSAISREKKLPTGIGQKMAIPHGDAVYVIRSVVAVAFLEKEIPWSNDENVDKVLLLAFNPDESLGMKDEILRFYKNFVIMLDELETYEQFRTMTSEKALVDMMNGLIA